MSYCKVRCRIRSVLYIAHTVHRVHKVFVNTSTFIHAPLNHPFVLALLKIIFRHFWMNFNCCIMNCVLLVIFFDCFDNSVISYKKKMLIIFISVCFDGNGCIQVGWDQYTLAPILSPDIYLLYTMFYTYRDILYIYICPTLRSIHIPQQHSCARAGGVALMYSFFLDKNTVGEDGI